VSAIPASSITTSVEGPISLAHCGRSPRVSDQVSLARVSVLVLICSRSAAAAAADGARPTTVPPPSVHAPASARIAVVLPAPAGAIASCSRAPEVAIVRTSAACPALRVTPLAVDSSRAMSTADSVTACPSTRPAMATRCCSAAMTLAEVNSCAPAMV